MASTVLGLKILAPDEESAFHFLLLARTYPSFNEQLYKAIVDEAQGLNEASKSMLLNIKFLMEFAIPTVRLLRVSSFAHHMMRRKYFVDTKPQNIDCGPWSQKQ